MPARMLLLALCACIGACAHRPSYDPADPLESLNRGVYSFNTTADRFVLRPVAVGYKKVMPGFARTGVNNFFANLFYPSTVVNQYLQGKFLLGTMDLGRFLVNTTFGLGGLLDVARHWGLPYHNEDFGQTFAVWGVGEGWYLMLPLLGPTTNRDLTGRIVDIPLNPTAYVHDQATLIWGLNLLDAIQLRAQLLNADRLLKDQLDPYIFIRGSYLQQRWSSIHDGDPPSEGQGSDDFDFDDF